MEESKLRYYRAQELKMIDLARADKKVSSQLLKEHAIHIHVKVNGPAGPIGVIVAPVEWRTAKEDVKTSKQTYCQVKSKIVERAKAMKRKVVVPLWKVRRLQTLFVLFVITFKIVISSYYLKCKCKAFYFL